MRIGAHLQLKAPLAVILEVELEPVVFNGSPCSPASSESWVVTVVYPEVCVSSLHNSEEAECVCVFSLRRTRAHNLHPTNQRPHSVSALIHSSDHTPVCNHTHTLPLSPCSHRCLCLVSWWKSVHCISLWHDSREAECVFVCVGFVFFCLPPAWSDHQQWTMNCSDKLSVSQSAKWSQSVWQTYLKSWRATFVPPVSPLNLTSFVKPAWHFSTHLK